MDPITALGVASAVVQFINTGLRISTTLVEYSKASPGDVPKALDSISTQLPLICHALSRIKGENEVRKYDTDIRIILNGVVLGCNKLIIELEDIAAKIQPKTGENLSTKLKKVLSNIKYEERIREIDRGLQAYAQVLILHQVVNRADVQVSAPAQTDYFEVKEKRVDDFTPRNDLIARLDEAFYKTVRSQTQKPVYVLLQGVAGAGKTQLALDYCHQTYNQQQFRTVFWLDASSPEVLKLGLEGAACVVQQTKAGFQEERLEYISQFLVDRWHPWLLVLDKYDPERFLKQPLTDLLPGTGTGAILILSSTRVNELGTTIKVSRYLTEVQEDDLRLDITRAIQSKDIKFIEDAIDQGFNVNSDSVTMWKKHGQPIINLAALVGSAEIVALLLDSGANPCPNRSIGSVLQTAVFYNSISVINTYLDFEDQSGHRAEPKIYLYAASTALEHNYDAVFNLLTARRPDLPWLDSDEIGQGFAKAAENGHVNMLRLVMSMKGPHLSDTKMAVALIEAVRAGRLEAVQYLLTEVKCDPNILDDSGRLPLYEATQVRDEQIRNSIVGTLMKAGASPVARRRSDDRTPLHSAAMYGYTSTISILLENNPDVTVQDEDGHTPLRFAADCSRKLDTYTLLTTAMITDTQARNKYFGDGLTVAAQKGDRDLAMLILKQIDFSSQNFKEMDALLTAIANGHTSVARMLLRGGAKQDVRNKDGKPPLVLAAEKGLDLVIRDLVRAKDSPGLETPDLTGSTPLMVAVKSNHKTTVETCLKLGADKDAMNDYGETAEDIAEENGFKEILELLQNGTG